MVLSQDHGLFCGRFGSLKVHALPTGRKPIALPWGDRAKAGRRPRAPVARGQPAWPAPVSWRVDGCCAQRAGGASRGRCGSAGQPERVAERRSEEHTSELQSLMRISYAVCCLKKKPKHITTSTTYNSMIHTTNNQKR